MTVFILTLLFMLIVVAMMAVGVMFGRGSIRGSCGGANCHCIKKCAKRKRMQMAEKV